MTTDKDPAEVAAEVGPTYNVPLLDALPLNYGVTKGMRQALPSRLDLRNAIAVGLTGRITAGYEVLLNYYYEQQQELDRLRRPKNFPKIVCLCGSTRFMDAFQEAGWQLTLDGMIVLTVGVCKHAEDHGGEALGQDVADKLDELHFRKIDLADWVFVLNVNGYIGESTRKEIEYAIGQGKQVTYLEPEAAEAKAREASDVPTVP